MTRDQYRFLIDPALDAVIDLLIANELKYGEGIKRRPQNMIKAAGHALSSERGLVNPDGETHATATASRSLIEVLYELGELHD